MASGIVLYKRGKKGIFWCRVRNRAGRIVRKSTHCVDREAALLVASKLERASADPTHARAYETTLEGCMNDYLDDLERRGRSDATKAIALQKCGHFIRLWGPKKAMGSIDARTVTEYTDTRRAEGVTGFTIKKELGHLRQVLTIARHHRVFHLAPEEVLPPYFVGEHKPKTRWPTPGELEALLAQLDKRRAAHVLFIVATGARWSESVKASRSDVMFELGIVRLHGTKTAAAAGDVPITPISLPYLQRAIDGAPGTSPLFHEWGKVWRDLQAACARAGIAPVSPNDLRRAFGHWHRASGVGLDLMSKILRHRTDKLAQTTYANIDARAVGRLIEKQLKTGVPDLYLSGGSGAQKELSSGHAADDEPPAKQAKTASAPGATRTCDLRFRKPTHELDWKRRSDGTKLGLLRKSSATLVPNLYPDQLEHLQSLLLTARGALGAS